MSRTLPTGWMERVELPPSLVSKLRAVASAVRRLPGGRTELTGVTIGHPLHPLLVTAPIGAWTSATALDLLGSTPRVARRLVGAGVVMALPTAMTGLTDWLDTDGAEQRVGALHAAVNATAVAAYTASWLLRPRHPRAGVATGFVAAGVATLGGWLGGHLVYAMGVGVDTNAFSSGPQEWTLLGGDTDPAPGRVGAVSADGTALVCAEVDGRLAVLADRCSHRGGPLSGGELRDGCFTCPWHGSRFDATTGAVRRGPASVHQPVYEARRRDGGVEVRRREQRALRTHPVG